MDPRQEAVFLGTAQRYRERVNEALNAQLPRESDSPRRLHAAMRYSVLNGGKRIRPLLVYATGEALGVDLHGLDAPACAVELMHAYSLIHDDLPAMDDDDLRRGKPTCHREFDEATALLAGDALQSFAFQVLVDARPPTINAEQLVRMVETLATASGPAGMAGGQAIDLGSVGQRLSLAQLEHMHRHKTGALIRASVRLGALAQPRLSNERFAQLDDYASCIGLAFQIKDDILDEEGETDKMGKSRGSDRERNKPTYPSIIGMEGAKRRALELHQTAVAQLEALGASADTLRLLSEYIVSRSE